MKRVLFALLSFLLVLPLRAGTVSSDGADLHFKTDSLSLDFSRYGVSMASSSFSVGAMDAGSGFLSSVDQSPESMQLKPSFSPVGKGTKVYGGSVRYQGLEAFVFFGKREGIGISGIRGKLAGTVMVANGLENSPRQVDLLLRRDFQTLYVLGKYEGKHLCLVPAFSVTETLLFSSFLAVDFSMHNMFISFSTGKLQSFLKDGDDYRQTFTLGYLDETVSMNFKLSLGRPPVYSYEYRTYEADWKITATYASLKFSDHVNKKFFKGKETRKETVSLAWKGCTASFDTEKGVSLSVHLGDTKIVLWKDSFSIETAFSKEDGTMEWKLKLSSERTFDVKITLRI